MKGSKLLQFIEKSGIDSSGFTVFKVSDMLTHREKSEFVHSFFGGDWVAGCLKSGGEYIAFFDRDNAPEGVADSVVITYDGAYILLFEIE